MNVEVHVTYKDHLPTVGIVAAICLFIVAAMHYPGGTTESATTVGYSWTHNFISTLFVPRAMNGAANPARYYADAAMLFLCVSLAIIFRQISLEIGPRVHKKTVEIGGIGSMVYGFLVVTPMHDLMVSIGLVFGLAALFAITHALYLERRRWLFGWGTICVVLSLVSAAMYYGDILYSYLPVVQKGSWVVWIAWLLGVYYTRSTPETE